VLVVTTATIIIAIVVAAVAVLPTAAMELIVQSFPLCFPSFLDGRMGQIKEWYQPLQR